MRVFVSVLAISMLAGAPAEAAIRYLYPAWSFTRTTQSNWIEHEPAPPTGWSGTCNDLDGDPFFYNCVDQAAEEADLVERVFANPGSADVGFITPWFGVMYPGIVANDIRRVSFQIAASHTGTTQCVQVEVLHDNGGRAPRDICFNEFSSPDGAGMHWIWNPQTEDRAFDLPKPSGGWTWPLLKNTMFKVFVKNKSTTTVSINSVRMRIWHY